MYQKYHTEALVLGSRERGESDRVIALYTRNFGLIYARASAIRAEKSRMRYALQHYARANVSLVKGKRGWRIAGVTPVASLRAAQREVGVFARIAQLLLRFAAREDRNLYLFEVLSEAHASLLKRSGVHGTVELICVARVLYALGYLSAEALGTALFTHSAYREEHLAETESLRDLLLSHVNRAIAESQL